MNADQAFDNLMRQNAFPIPKGRRDAAPARNQADAEPEEDAVRVSELFDAEEPDYRPRPAGRPANGGRSATSPTESLPGVAGGGELDLAASRGARIMGRDADDDASGTGTDALRPRVDEDTVAELPDADIEDDAEGEAETRPGFARDRGLGKARRVRRFGYLPLAGMEAFESGARDLAIRLAAGRPDKPSLAVTSAARGEGRTEIAIRLALALAKRVGSRVLLADFDIKRPQAAQRLGISTKYFVLQDVLAGTCPLGEAVVMGEEDNLFVLPSKASERDGDDILEGRRVAKLLEEMHASFDFTVLDCGPAGQTDALTVCLAAGSVAFAGYCGLTRASRLNDAAKRLATAGANVAGVILAGGPA